MNPLLQGHSGTTPKPSRNALSTSQGTNEDDSQKDPHPKAGLLHCQMTQNSGPEDGHDMVTEATEQNRKCHDMTEVHEEVTYCSPSAFSGQKKTTLPVNRNSAVRTPLRRSKQTKFCCASAVDKKQQFCELSQYYQKNFQTAKVTNHTAHI